MVHFIAGVVLLALGILIGYEIGNSVGFTDGYEVGSKMNKWE